MKTWFIRHNNENLGPYTVDELKKLAVTRDDYVWKEGLKNWVQAKSVPELNQIFEFSTPPSFIAKNKNSNKPARSRKRMLWISLLLIMSMVTYLIYANNNSTLIAPFNSPTQKSPEQIKVELAQTERENPVQYISGRMGHRKNWIGETVIEGTLSNAATVAAYKDVVLHVDFYSKTNTVITTRRFTIYEMMNPGQTIAFKVKTIVPKDVTDLKVSIMGASGGN